MDSGISEEQSDPGVLFSTDQKTATITLNRPKSMNALRWEEMDAIIGFIQEADNNADVNVIRIRSAGDRAFCGGLDISMLSDFTPNDIPRLLEKGNKIVHMIIKATKPVVIQIQGPAVGWGCITSLAADFVIAGENPKTFFSLPEIDLGIYPATGALSLALRSVGLRYAKQMLMFSQKIYLDQAAQLGLVTKRVPLDKLEEETRIFCQNLAEKKPEVLYLIKAVLNNIHMGELDRWLAKEAEATASAHSEGSLDFRDFIEKIWKK